MEYIKTKSAAKIVIPRGERLESEILQTLRTIADIVGGTLGPGGRPVLIERPEWGLPPFITKDGVSVFRSLAFPSAVAHCIMETTRDSSVRTADEAGDGTTTATILAYSFTAKLLDFCRQHPHISPQSVVREITDTYRNVLAPTLKKLAKKARIDTAAGRRILLNVAKISANGDKDLAKAVMEAFSITGDDGNVTIVESSGPPGVDVEQVKGYPLPIGYEESCQHQAVEFINRPETQQALLDKPMFLLYFGRINDMSTLLPILDKIFQGVQGDGRGEGAYLKTPNLAIVATGFSDMVLKQMALNWKTPQALNMLPIKVPHSPFTNGDRQFLEDLAAVTAGTVYDQITNPIEDATFEGLGNLIENENGVWETLGITQVEMGRYRTTIHGFAHEETLMERADQVRKQVEQAESQMDKVWTQERLAKLTGGIARIRVIGSSNAEVKERRDRVEDAVCAVRGALKHGAVVGGGWALARLAEELSPTLVNTEVVIPALLEPISVLYSNAGVPTKEVPFHVNKLRGQAAKGASMKSALVFDAAKCDWVVGYKEGLLDSVPAVGDALKNSISVATTLGTTGGLVVQPRDSEFERKDARDAADFQRAANVVEEM